MSTLSKLYITMENQWKLNLPIVERLKQEAARHEDDLIRTEIFPSLTEKIEPASAQVQREFVLVVDYLPNESLKVSLSRKCNITDVPTDAAKISPKLPNVVTTTDILRGPNMLFCVIFKDGHISEGNGKDTLIDALQHMFLPRVATFDLRTFAEILLDGRFKRQTDDNNKWQEQIHYKAAMV